MHAIVTTLHATGGTLVIGTLFVQSLILVMALRLPGEEQREGVRLLQERVHLYVYYPMLGLTLLLGLWTAFIEHAFSRGRWLHWKLVLIVLLIGLGLLVGRAIRSGRVAKPAAMAVHVVIFLLAIGILYLAVLKPF